jgi:hypothetical protein
MVILKMKIALIWERKRFQHSKQTFKTFFSGCHDRGTGEIATCAVMVDESDDCAHSEWTKRADLCPDKVGINGSDGDCSTSVAAQEFGKHNDHELQFSAAQDKLFVGNH